MYRVSLFIISLLVSVSLIAGGCSGPKPIKPLTDEEKAELDKLNATAAASIDDYVKNAGHLTEQQADQVVHNQTQFQSQRAALLDKYYGQVKGALGPEAAARFYEAESQLLSLSDLQRSSKLSVE